MIDASTRARWRRMFDARTAGPWAHEPGREVVESVVYRRPVCQTSHHEDADYIAQSYEGWPRTLDELERVEAERDAARNELERILAKLERSLNTSERLDRERMLADERAHIAAHKRSELNRENEELAKLASEYANQRGELIRMLDAWRRHRNSPLLIADFTRYLNDQKESP